MPIVPKNTPHRGRARAARVVLACLLLALAACSSVPAPEPAPLRVMTFNVRVPIDTDDNRWELRRDALVQTIADADPDLLGTQELVPDQAGLITARLPQLAWFGIARSAEADDEHMGVFYRRDRMRLLESGHFWLSDTPEVPASISWGNLYPRMVTWGLFERRADGQRVALLNTHLPYREQDDAARERGAALIVARLAALPPDVPVVVLGDFNSAPGSAAHRTLTAALDDAWDHATRRSGPAGTYTGFGDTPGERIDWVLSRGLQVREVRTIDTRIDGRLPSDHFPVLVEFVPKTAAHAE
ncbi:endonuclease/exonuclease/phosphatase family protein [Luteimonas kalidii]|uniref:Endonuclease/exonuclease/phosphatase family protein n=1 Tax=Luteimonas kalidii TaxID=3042025 RepID=A0ABT6JSN8_9GAMM|nr:endonuclease/exonuclease/phosphatase family protein [Luteimonas kalidii]MDH5833488.1 endonuclease/exonuclease/phosphatase family protein [Luteimonas kalidii]